MHLYTLTIKHDTGKVNMTVFATDEQKAIEKITKTVNCPESAITKIIQKYWFVEMTDKFMSGWGKAEGKINKFIVQCDTFEQAETIERNAHRRSEMKHISIKRGKMTIYNQNKYIVSLKNYNDLGEIWKKL